jgi:pyruvate formate lyase activating enzyme
MTGLVARVLESSFIDGPGHRAVVFMQGCNMRCKYCHNPETRGLCDACGECLAVCPGGALSRRADGSIAWDASHCRACDRCIAICPRDASPRATLVEASDLAARIAALEPFIDGVTFSGGECCLQSPFLLEVAPLIQKLRAGLGVIADTNGALTENLFAPLLAGLDGFIFDLKAWNEATHRGLTGLPIADVRRNMEAAAAAGKLTEVRTVLIEGVNDSVDDLADSAAYLASLGGSFRWRLIPFRPQGVRGEYASRDQYPKAAFEEALSQARSLLGERAIGPAATVGW